VEVFTQKTDSPKVHIHDKKSNRNSPLSASCSEGPVSDYRLGDRLVSMRFLPD
jgi:hypothetical protein